MLLAFDMRAGRVLQTCFGSPVDVTARGGTATSVCMEDQEVIEDDIQIHLILSKINRSRFQAPHTSPQMQREMQE